MSPVRPGVDWWYCTPCDEWWLEDGKGILTMPAECGPCGKPMTLIGERRCTHHDTCPHCKSLLGVHRDALIAALEFTRRPDQLDATALSQLRSILTAGLAA